MNFSQWKGEFWIQKVIRAPLDTCLSLSSIDEEPDEVSFTPLQTSEGAKKLNKIDSLSFVYKEIASSEMNLLCFAHYFSRLFPRFFLLVL